MAHDAVGVRAGPCPCACLFPEDPQETSRLSWLGVIAAVHLVGKTTNGVDDPRA